MAIEKNLVEPGKPTKPWVNRVIGGGLVLLGFGAFLFPFIGSLAAGVFAGSVILCGSVLRLLHQNPNWNGQIKALNAGAAILGFITAALLLIFPVSGVLTLTLLVGAYFAATGIMRLAEAFSTQVNRGWRVLGGVLDLLLGTVVLMQWPTAAIWFLGVLLGVHLTMNGVALLFAPQQVLRSAVPPAGPTHGAARTVEERVSV